jgi:NitT/TauT family transport system substrate-binding protein
MRKLISVVLSIVLVLALLVGCGNTAPNPTPTPSTSAPATNTTEPSNSPEPTKPEPVKVRVAHHAGLSGSLSAGIDIANKYFEEEGLIVEWVLFTSGPPEVAAMISGDIQFGYLGHGAHTLAAEGKIDVISLSHLGNSEKIYSRKDSGINSIADLKGKVIATQLGTSGEVILNMALDSVGLTKDDVKIMNMDMSGAVTAFIADKVDAIACWDIHATNVVDNVGIDNLNLIAKTGDFSDKAAFPGSWVVTPEYAEKNEELVLRFIRGLYKTYDYRDTNFDDAIKAAASFREIDYETFSKTRNDLAPFNSDDIKAMLDDGSLLNIYQVQLDYFISEGKLESGDVNSYVRTDLMKKAFENYQKP